MDSDNLIFNMPFDESNGSAVAYDYSKNRADGVVTNATFVSGKNGNAIKFNGDGGNCDVSKNIITNMGMAFTMLAWVNQGTIETGSPTKLIWLLNFSGLNNSVAVPIEAASGTWFHLAITRSGGLYNFYVNGSLIKTINNSGSLQGVSLNQDYYGSDYALATLDDVKIYNTALTQAEITNSLSTAKQQVYYLDGVDFKTYGVYVAASDGVVNRPKLKDMASVSWDNYHGETVDLYHKFYQPREITLDCFIKATSKDDFITKMSTFEQLFDKTGTQRLLIDVHPIKPLIYEVYCKDEIDVSKKWNDALMVGTFKLKLIEPEPVKRILKHMRVGDSTKKCTITMTTIKYVNIYWGDGTVDYDVCGDKVTITHDYANKGDYLPLIAGCIDEISSFTTNAIIVWNKL